MTTGSVSFELFIKGLMKLYPDLWSAPVTIGGLYLGTPAADMLVGSMANELFLAGPGADTVYGGGGHDFVLGGSGADTVYGGAAQDVLFGEAGDDMLHSGGGSNLLWGGEGDDLLDARWATDADRGSVGFAAWRAEKLLSTDEMHGGAGDDTLWGSYGADRLYGDAGDDMIYGQDGDDRLEGCDGNDVLDGGAGVDLLAGGAGDDVFVLRDAGWSLPDAADRIIAAGAWAAFEDPGRRGGDRISLALIDADAGTEGDQAFVFALGYDPDWLDQAGRLWATNVGSNTMLRGTTDAEAGYDFEVMIVDGGDVLAANYRGVDFIL